MPGHKTRNEATLRSLIDATQETLVMIDRDGTVLLSNATGAKRLGKRIGDLIGTCLYDHFPPDVARRRKAEINKVFNTARPVYFEDTRAGRDFELYCSPILNDTGKVARAVIFAHEITARNIAQAEAIAWKKRYDLVVSSSRQIVYDMALSNNRVILSGNLSQVLGYTPEELEPDYFEQWKRLVNPVHLPGILAIIEEAARQKGPFQMEYEFRHKDGHYIYVLDKGFFFHHGASGEETRVMGIIQDISGRKRAEDIIARSLEEQNSMFRELQHRIKNSLSIIASLVSLEAGNHSEGETRSALLSIKDRISSLGNLYQILYQTGNSRNVMLDRYLTNIVESLTASYIQDSSRILINVHFEEIAADMKVAAPLGLMVNELVTNALKHAFPGDTQGTVDVSLIRFDGGVVLTVSDDGTGLPHDFDADNTSGLGMQIVSLLTEQLDARLVIRNVGRTGFSIQLGPEGFVHD